MSDSETYANFVRDTLRLVRDAATSAKAARERAPSDFNRGRVLAYYEVLSTVRHEATTFGIDLADVSLADFDPDRELL